MKKKNFDDTTHIEVPRRIFRIVHISFFVRHPTRSIIMLFVSLVAVAVIAAPVYGEYRNEIKVRSHNLRSHRYGHSHFVHNSHDTSTPF